MSCSYANTEKNDIRWIEKFPVELSNVPFLI